MPDPARRCIDLSGGDRDSRFRRTAILLLLAALVIAGCGTGDGAHEHEVHAEESVLSRLAEKYRPVRVLPEAQARDSLFGVVARESDDSVRCVYTGKAIHIEPGHDPTKYAYSLKFTTEHVYPKSKGAKRGAAEADLHNLFPAIEFANMARQNFAFGEIDSAKTERWICRHGRFRDGTHRANEPVTRLSTALGLVEPPDESKGDVARAVFYFYLVYRDSADRYDPSFFPLQKARLLDWHRRDPPDTDEIMRTKRIAAIQGNVNPFVMDTSLVAGAF